MRQLQYRLVESVLQHCVGPLVLRAYCPKHLRVADGVEKGAVDQVEEERLWQSTPK